MFITAHLTIGRKLVTELKRKLIDVDFVTANVNENNIPMKQILEEHHIEDGQIFYKGSFPDHQGDARAYCIPMLNNTKDQPTPSEVAKAITHFCREKAGSSLKFYWIFLWFKVSIVWNRCFFC